MDFSRQDNWVDYGWLKTIHVDWDTVEKNYSHTCFKSNVSGVEWLIRMNDFPDEPLYTLIVGGKEIIHFNEWPVFWGKPAAPTLKQL